MIPRDQRLFNGCRAALGQVQIVRIAANVIGMTLDGQLPCWIVCHGLDDLLQHRLRLRLDGVFVEVEVDAVGDGALLLRQLLFNDVDRAVRFEVDLDDLNSELAIVQGWGPSLSKAEQADPKDRRERRDRPRHG